MSAAPATIPEEPTAQSAAPFKLPKARSVTLWWLTEGVTKFIDGAIDGVLMGTGSGGVAAAGTIKFITLDDFTVIVNAIIGFLTPIFISGFVTFKAWKKDNPLQNPFYKSRP